jgi:hypothetical protein
MTASAPARAAFALRPPAVASLAPTAVTTTALHARESASIHPRRTSLPVPSECASAGGQHA